MANTGEAKRISLSGSMLQVFGIDHLSFPYFFEFGKSTRTRANHDYKLYLRKAVCYCYKYSFFIRIAREWNDLPGHIAHAESLSVFELFFVKKIPLSRRVGYVMGGWISGSVDQWISGSCLYVTPIRLDLLLETNQISCCKGKWYVRRFDPDTVENGHIYSSIKEKEVFRYWAYFDIFCGLG